MKVVLIVLMFVFGACFGSFLCCQARRLHRKAEGKKKLGSRSVCLSCKYQLKWYDNIPILSWLFLRGRCRKCGKRIGLAELLSEIACASAFALLSININVETAGLAEWLIYAFTLLLTLSLCFLGIYDGLYGELPSIGFALALIPAVALCAAPAIIDIITGSFSYEYITNPLISALFFGGIYLLLYLISKGKWVGDGDWLLAGIIGLALGSAWLSLIALFIANLSACIIMLPAVMKSKNSKIYFGPFLVLAYVVVMSFAPFFMSIML